LNNACYSLTNKVINRLYLKFHHTKQETPKKPGFAMFESNKPTIKGDSPPIVDNDQGFDFRDYELSDDDTNKTKFTNIIQCIIDLCDFPSDSLMLEYITNEAWSMLTNVTTIMVDKVDKFHIHKKDGLF
jgi:hypothetical protein